MAKREVVKREGVGSHVAGTPRTGGATTAGVRDANAKTSGDPLTDFERKYGAVADTGQAQLERKLETERQLAQQQAAGKLGFAQSSGPGTGGRWAATETALNREFNLAKMMNLERSQLWRSGLEIDYLQRQDAYSQQQLLAKMQFDQNMALMQQQAELNSAAWWEQVGSIIGFGLALAVPGGGSVAAWGVGQMFGGVKDA